MDAEHDELRTARVIIYAVVIALGIWTGLFTTGCASFIEAMTRPSTAPPKTFLDRTELKVNARSRETDFGTSLDDYTCGEQLMFCEVFGGTMYCRCVARGVL